MKMKKEKVKIFGKTIEVKKGALHRQLKYKGKFSNPMLNKLSKVEDGKKFKFKGNEFKMTKLLKKRVALAKAFAKVRPKKK
jgi:hypothetical protein